jgi:uncharacterized protein with PIN domain
MPSVTIRFYEELNLFLPPALRKRPFSVAFAHGCTVKAFVEDQGVPHTEVDLLLVNGVSVGFAFPLHDGDRVSVYPVFESLDISSVSRVRSTPLRETKFALDVHLGKLARLLRMFGFDSSYATDAEDGELVQLARRESRIILTRDRGLLKRRLVSHGYLVRGTEPREQIAEVIGRFDLTSRVRMFGRCMMCNTPLERCEKKEVRASLPASVADAHEEYSRCPSCARVFWKGSHWEGMKKLAGEVLGERPAGSEVRPRS